MRRGVEDGKELYRNTLRIKNWFYRHITTGKIYGYARLENKVVASSSLE